MSAHARRLGTKRGDSRKFRALKIKAGELAKARAPRPLAHRVSAAAIAAVMLSGEIHYALPGEPRLCFDFDTGKTARSDKDGDTARYGLGAKE